MDLAAALGSFSGLFNAIIISVGVFMLCSNRARMEMKKKIKKSTEKILIVDVNVQGVQPMRATEVCQHAVSFFTWFQFLPRPQVSCMTRVVGCCHNVDVL